MLLIIYIFFVFLSLCIAWQLGKTAHGNAGNLLVFTVIILGANYCLTRRLCFALGAITLLLGFVAPTMIWTYGHFYIHCDPSGYGMIGTLLAFIFIPIGLGLALVGWRKDT